MWKNENSAIVSRLGNENIAIFAGRTMNNENKA